MQQEAPSITNEDVRKENSADAGKADDATPEDAAVTLAELSEKAAASEDHPNDDGDGSDNDSDVDLSKKCENGFTETFPQRLREVIETEGAEKSIIWSTDGMSFMITSPRIFVNSILPMYFRQTKFASFTRKLNRWGFKRITKGPNAGAYFHKLFQRDKPELCNKMVCQKVKVPRKKKPSAQAAKSASSLSGTSLNAGNLTAGLLQGASSDLVDRIIRERAVAALNADQRLQALQLQALRQQVEPSSSMLFNSSLLGNNDALLGGGGLNPSLLESATLRRQMLLEANRRQLGLMYPSSSNSASLGLGLSDTPLLSTMERLYQQDVERLMAGRSTSSSSEARLMSALQNASKDSSSNKPTALGDKVEHMNRAARGA